MSDNHPIKDHLFSFVDNSQDIPEMISKQRFDHLVHHILDGCFDDIVKMDMYDNAIGILATSMLHYILTATLIPSQRKIKHQGVDLDIVIPDTQTLSQDPKRSLVICIPMSSDADVIHSKILEIESINPTPNNIWVVLSDMVDINKNTFVLDRSGESFTNCILEIAKFYNTRGDSRLKILRI